MVGVDPGIFQAADKFFFKPVGDTVRDAEAENAARSGPTVLVVDDQRMVADTTAEILNQNGFRAISAYSGDAALLLAQDLKPDYLLADVMMPGMNGIELAIAVNKVLPTTRVTLFSGQAGVTDLLQDAKAEGYLFEILAKPIHPEKLIEYLKKK